MLQQRVHRRRQGISDACAIDFIASERKKMNGHHARRSILIDVYSNEDSSITLMHERRRKINRTLCLSK
jgi:hypothetical protein